MSRGRLLLVEDEALLLIDLEELLTEAGYEVVGKATDLRGGLLLARSCDFDLAILDFDLGRVESWPIADLLEERGVPYVFATAMKPSWWPERHRGRPHLDKPYSYDQVRRCVAATLQRVRSHSELAAASEPRVPPPAVALGKRMKAKGVPPELGVAWPALTTPYARVSPVR